MARGGGPLYTLPGGVRPEGDLAVTENQQLRRDKKKSKQVNKNKDVLISLESKQRYRVFVLLLLSSVA